jgi:large subunit ribosomal protein L21
MYAVIKTGGKQYRVKEGDVLKFETLSQEVGEDIQFEQVLLVGEGDSVICGTPFISKAVVKGSIMAHGRHKKIRIVKFRRRKHYMKRMGHRQNFTQVKIISISAPK